MKWIVLFVIFLYYGVGSHLTDRAFKHLRDDAEYTAFPAIYYSKYFRPEGEKYRKIALRYWFGGIVVLAAFLWLVNKLVERP